MVLPDGENSIVSTSACSLALTPAEAAPALRDLCATRRRAAAGQPSLGDHRRVLGAARQTRARRRSSIRHPTGRAPRSSWRSAPRDRQPPRSQVAGARDRASRRRDRHARGRRMPVRGPHLSRPRASPRSTRRAAATRSAASWRRPSRKDAPIEGAIAVAQKAAALTATGPAPSPRCPRVRSSRRRWSAASARQHEAHAGPGGPPPRPIAVPSARQQAAPSCCRRRGSGWRSSRPPHAARPARCGPCAPGPARTSGAMPGSTSSDLALGPDARRLDRLLQAHAVVDQVDQRLHRRAGRCAGRPAGRAQTSLPSRSAISGAWWW